MRTYNVVATGHIRNTKVCHVVQLTMERTVLKSQVVELRRSGDNWELVLFSNLSRPLNANQQQRAIEFDRRTLSPDDNPF